MLARGHSPRNALRPDEKQNAGALFCDHCCMHSGCGSCGARRHRGTVACWRRGQLAPSLHAFNRLRSKIIIPNSSEAQACGDAHIRVCARRRLHACNNSQPPHVRCSYVQGAVAGQMLSHAPLRSRCIYDRWRMPSKTNANTVYGGASSSSSATPHWSASAVCPKRLVVRWGVTLGTPRQSMCGKTSAWLHRALACQQSAHDVCMPLGMHARRLCRLLLQLRARSPAVKGGSGCCVHRQ